MNAQETQVLAEQHPAALLADRRNAATRETGMLLSRRKEPPRDNSPGRVPSA